MGQAPTPLRSQSNPADLVGDLIKLRDPRNPCRRLEPAIGRLVPRPLRHFEDLERFAHLDVPDLALNRRALEALRIRTAIALARDPDRTPPWLLERLQRLEAAN